MKIDVIQAVDVIEVMENYLQRKRPPENLRAQLDLMYRIEEQSIIIFEIRPRWDNPTVFIESRVAKTTFIKSKNHWKIFWMRADLKWHSYKPNPTVKEIKDFVRIVDEDKYGCFWG
ncbi:DUF3024 domain-containing protein [Sediminibacterium sp.]|uniref:DUF3024 domain-containing protein n=1 Tax=Sediminibacterium sp. TaxID=1917865 RepID=UPI0025DF158A|nr:DUF3024 domain-containing protein [Sediminibacterium sp.]MBW0176884.1 DUF3024 domain-containing protein [Sediminibacterium sp.]